MDLVLGGHRIQHRPRQDHCLLNLRVRPLKPLVHPYNARPFSLGLLQGPFPKNRLQRWRSRRRAIFQNLRVVARFVVVKEPEELAPHLRLLERDEVSRFCLTPKSCRLNSLSWQLSLSMKMPHLDLRKRLAIRRPMRVCLADLRL